MNAFHVCGAILALWALLVAFLGITREDFPASKTVARIVGAVSVVLAIAAVTSAILTGSHEEEHEEGEREAAALLLPSL